MDFAAISAIAASLTAARDIGVAALSVRDSNLLALEVARMNENLLNAQQRLFALQTDLLALQQEHFEAREELRKVLEAMAQRERYTLVEVGRGNWAYRENVVPQLGGPGDPAGAQPAHYVCQQCFDGGRKVVLRFVNAHIFGPQLSCHVCKAELTADRVNVG